MSQNSANQEDVYEYQMPKEIYFKVCDIWMCLVISVVGLLMK